MFSAKDLRLLRKKRNITQKKLAELAGVSQSLIARIEKGDVDTRVSTMNKLKNALQKSKPVLASDIMSKPVHYVIESDSVTRVIYEMDKRLIYFTKKVKRRTIQYSGLKMTIVCVQVQTSDQKGSTLNTYSGNCLIRFGTVLQTAVPSESLRCHLA